MKTQRYKGEPEASVEATAEVPTLNALYALNKKHYNKYQINITPRGKGQTHKTLYKSFIPEINRYKCVKDVFLIAEFENTEHFHGYVYTKDKCKFKNLFKKSHPFDFKISQQEDIVWLHYITKHSSKRYQLHS